MKIGAMNHPARDPLGEIEWIGQNAFDFVDFTLEPLAADADQIAPRAVRAALDRHSLGVVAHTLPGIRLSAHPSVACARHAWPSVCGSCEWPARSVPRS